MIAGEFSFGEVVIDGKLYKEDIIIVVSREK